MDDKVHTTRLMADERSYLKKYYENSFSKFVHDSFKHNIDLTKNNKKKNRLQKYSQAFVMIAFGIMFFFLTMQQSSLVSALLIFLLGVFFSATGLSTIYYDRKERKL